MKLPNTRLFLLDSNVLIEHLFGKSEQLRRNLRKYQDKLVVPSIVIMEVSRGLMSSRNPAHLSLSFQKFLEGIFTVTFDEAAARIAAQLLANLDRKKIDVKNQILDIMIAAIALRYELTLVTANIKDFKHAHRLETVNWMR